MCGTVENGEMRSGNGREFNITRIYMNPVNLQVLANTGRLPPFSFFLRSSDYLPLTMPLLCLAPSSFLVLLTHW